MGCCESSFEQARGGPSTVSANVAPPLKENESSSAQGEKSVIVENTKLIHQYDLGRVLGKGNYSTVRLGQNKVSGKKVAVKCIIKSKLTTQDFEALKAETQILKMLDHPNIIKLFDVYDEDQMYYIVTEFVPGGELFDRIVQKEFYSEEDAQNVIIKIAKALQFCHNNQVVHRDLKPENILLASLEDDAEIKLCDFGFAKTVDPEVEGLETPCGTPGYVAPEIINGAKYGKEIDVWSLGVISYILLCGYPPFRNDNRRILFQAIRRGQYVFDSPWWDNISDDAKRLVRRMLTVNPRKRITIPEILESPWLTSSQTRDITPALVELRNFNAKRKMKVGTHAIRAANHFVQTLRQASSLSDNSKKSEPEGEDAVEDN